MLLNLALLLLLFGAEKKKISPYVAALAFGLIKGVITMIFSGSIVAAVIVAALFAGLAAAFVYFLKRIDRREDLERPEVPTYGSPGNDTVKFKWEYIPLVVLLLLIVGGDMLLR